MIVDKEHRDTMFGIRDGKVININELNQNERGLKCRCVCSVCGEPLSAKLGDIREWHFAHKSQCEGSFETALHIFAKEVLEKNKKIFLPDINIFYTDKSTSVSGFSYKENNFYSNYEFRKETVVKGREIHFQKVELEKKVDDIIPDVILYYKNIPLVVEIAVTHFINDIKREKIENKKLSTLEIDLSNYDFNNFNKQELENLIINEVKNKSWIYNKTAMKRIEQIILSNKEKKKQLIEREKVRQERIKKLAENRVKRINRVLENRKDIEERNFINIESNYYWKIVSKKLRLDKYNMPFFLNKAINGEEVFMCHRMVWQSELYYKFIENRKEKIIECVKIISWIRNYSQLKLNKDLLYAYKNKCTNIPTLTDVVYDYLQCLNELGIIRCISNHHKYYSKYEVVLDNIFNIKNMKKDDVIKLSKDTYNENIQKAKERALFNSISFTKLAEEKLDKLIEKEVVKVSPVERKSFNSSRDIKSYNKCAVCEICGQASADWVVFNGKTNTCKCRKCWDNIDW